jgi:hypothetical protein
MFASWKFRTLSSFPCGGCEKPSLALRKQTEATNPRDYRALGFVLGPVFCRTQKNATFQTFDMFLSSGEGVGGSYSVVCVEKDT